MEIGKLKSGKGGTLAGVGTGIELLIEVEYVAVEVSRLICFVDVDAKVIGTDIAIADRIGKDVD